MDEEAPCPRRDSLEDAIAKLLDVRDLLAAEARLADDRARNRLAMARRRTNAPTTHTKSNAPLSTERLTG